ncbi:hypothetical protein [Prosthecobacter sp.]|jgi:hypothetical protein|uniref:hypothetical protein n=1 Tax=Prosthecobacter sp. TaxID=1965333 RepID=UPI0037C887CE
MKLLVLQTRLKADTDLRRLYLHYMNLDVALEAQAGSRDRVIDLLRAAPLTENNPAGRWYSWRPLTAAAAGIALGMFCTSVVFGYVGPRVVEKVKTVFDEGFESGVTKTEDGLPREVRHWSGDEAEVVASAPGVKAHVGAKMLRFLSATYPGENSPRSQWGDVYRLVDVRGLAGDGRTVARVSASFRQGAVTGEERFACRVGAYALDQDLSTLPSPLNLAWLQQNNSAAGSRRAVLTGSPHWHDVSVEVPITRETRYVMLHLAMVQEQPTLKYGAVQFQAHFMDDVKLEIVSDR